MTHLLLSRLSTGWFCPRLPKGSLYVLQPAAAPSSWLPMQMPKRGLVGAAPESCASMTSLTCAIVVVITSGLPGPLERKRPSCVSMSGSSGVSHGTRFTSQSRCTRERMMFALMPQSTASTLYLLPLP